LTLVAHQRATFSYSSRLSVSSTYCSILYWFLIPLLNFLFSVCDSTNPAIRISIMYKQAKTWGGGIIFTDKKRNRWNSIGADKSRKFHIWMCFRLLTTQLCIMKKIETSTRLFPIVSLWLSASAKNPHHRRQPTSLVRHWSLRRRRPTLAQLHRDWR
jgi:hypothetical protein